MPEEFLRERRMAWTMARRKGLFELAGYNPNCVTWKCTYSLDFQLEVTDTSSTDASCLRPTDLEIQASPGSGLGWEYDAIIQGTGNWSYDIWKAGQPARK